MKLWLRIGDSDDYNDYDNLEDIAVTLADLDVQNIVRYCRFGFEGDNYTGFQNYISLYHGDKNADPTDELTDEEMYILQKHLDKYNGKPNPD